MANSGNADPASRLDRQAKCHVEVAKWLVHQHKVKHRTFQPLLPVWSEPIWAMLLSLYIATEEGDDVSTTSLCLTAEIPVSSALRHVLQLCDGGFIERRIDSNDGRRILVTLAPKVKSEMQAYFTRIWRGEVSERHL